MSLKIKNCDYVADLLGILKSWKIYFNGLNETDYT